MTSYTRVVIPGAALIGVCYGFARFAYGLFLPQIREDIGLSATLAGFIGSGAYVGYALAIIASAFLVERFGPRRVAVGAALIAASGMAVMAASASPWLLAGAVLFAGMSTGLASPPMAVAVSRGVPPARQAQANTIINAGTSIGVVVSGPVAFLATGQWRIAYAAFALAAVANAFWLARSLPERPADGPAVPQASAPGAGLLRRDALAVVLASMGMGLGSSALWAFASDVIVTLGHHPMGTANLAWVVLGLSGLAGAFGGDLAKRFGITAVHRASLLGMAAALMLIVYQTQSAWAVYGAAALFGAAYIMVTGIYLIWGVRVYADRPALGLSLPFLMIAVGQIIGLPIAGKLIASIGYQGCFTAFAVICTITCLLRCNAPSRSEAGCRCVTSAVS